MTAAIGDSFIDAVEKKGFRGALSGAFDIFRTGFGPSAAADRAQIKQDTKERRAELLASVMDPTARAQTQAMAGLGFSKAKRDLEEDNIKLQELGQFHTLASGHESAEQNSQPIRMEVLP